MGPEEEQTRTAHIAAAQQHIDVLEERAKLVQRGIEQERRTLAYLEGKAA
jgi:hypothetical protein